MTFLAGWRDVVGRTLAGGSDTDFGGIAQIGGGAAELIAIEDDVRRTSRRRSGAMLGNVAGSGGGPAYERARRENSAQTAHIRHALSSLGGRRKRQRHCRESRCNEKKRPQRQAHPVFLRSVHWIPPATESTGECGRWIESAEIFAATLPRELRALPLDELDHLRLEPEPADAVALLHSGRARHVDLGQVRADHVEAGEVDPELVERRREHA